MMNYSLYEIRDRFHPLYHLRRHSLSRRLLSAIDIPVWANLPGVDWKVRVRLIRHASFFMLSNGADPNILRLYRLIHNHIGIRSFWDVGANIGYYSWVTRSLEPKADIRMFEPEDENLSLIRATIRRANLHEITVREVAVSSACGQRCFVRDEVSGATGGIGDGEISFSQLHWNAIGAAQTINTASLDEERANAGNVDLIKIDVEGHEEAVIRGAQQTIRDDQPTLIFECFHGGNEITDYLGSLGYWIGNAENFDDDLTNVSNFIALPARHRGKLDRMRRCRTEQMSETDFKTRPAERILGSLD
jgi:FkbM family methyltransferase